MKYKKWTLDQKLEILAVLAEIHGIIRPKQMAQNEPKYPPLCYKCKKDTSYS